MLVFVPVYLAQFMQSVLVGWGLTFHRPTPCFTDSASTMLIATGDAAMKRSAYIRRRIWMMIQSVHDRLSAVLPVPGKVNTADPLTKYVPKKEFLAMRKWIMGEHYHVLD